MHRFSRLSYKKLKQDPTLYDEEERQTVRQIQQQERQTVRQIQQQERQTVRQIQQQERPRRSRFRLRRRWRRISVPGLRRFFKRVRRGNLVWGSCAKVVRRLKESQAHFGDLFAGNYLFLQVTPDSLKFKSKAPPPLPCLPSARV